MALPKLTSLFSRNNNQEALQRVLANIDRIRQGSDEIMITGEPNGNSWRGVYNGAIAFFPERLVTIPQHYSTPVFSIQEIETICFHLVKSGFTKVIFSGYTPGYKPFFTALAKFGVQEKSGAKVFLIHHSSLTTNREDAGVIPTLKEILEMNRQGIIHRIGFIKKGMAETFEAVAGIHASHLIPMTKKIPDQVFKKIKHNVGLQIGVFTHDHYRKNIDNQVAAALMFPLSSVHVHRNSEFSYLFNDQRIHEHAFLDEYNDFLSLIGSMTMNFYVTLSECFGLFVTESLALGVPCLAALNSGLFDYDDALRKYLVVEEFDNSAAIHEQAKTVLARRDEISARGKEYVQKLNAIAAAKLEAFLNS